MVMILVGIVLVGIGWFWWRGDVVDNAPTVDAAVAIPLPVVTGPYDPVASDCREGVAWTSTHTRPWQSLAQEYEGTVDACMEVYRITDEEVGDGDFYVAVVTSSWTRTDREDFWYPWDGGADAPGPVAIEVTVAPGAIGNSYDASRPSVEDCAATIPDAPVLLDGADPLGTPTFVAGACGGTIERTSWDADGATWTATRPEEFDLTVTSFQVKVPEGTVPRFQLSVAQG